MASNPKPARRLPPGAILSEEIKARGWTQARFAEILGRPLQSINLLLNGKRELTPDTALQIAAALGTSADIWVELESKYRLWLAEQQAQDLEAIRARARLAG